MGSMARIFREKAIKASSAQRGPVIEKFPESIFTGPNTWYINGPGKENRKAMIKSLQATAKEHVGSSIPPNDSGPNSRMNTEKGSDDAR